MARAKRPAPSTAPEAPHDPAPPATLRSIAQGLADDVAGLGDLAERTPAELRSWLLAWAARQLGPVFIAARANVDRVRRLLAGVADPATPPVDIPLAQVFTGGRLRGKGASKVPSFGIWPIMRAHRVVETQPDEWLWAGVCTVEDVGFMVLGVGYGAAVPDMWSSL